MILLDQVSKAYPTSHGTVQALGETSLEIPDGRYVSIRGRSGSGKSTLLALLGGLATPTSGRIVIDGFEVSSANAAQRAAWRAENVGFVFQMFHLLPYLDVLQNVIAASASPSSEVTQRATELLRRFGLQDRLHHRPGQLSAGERQRTAVARALINEPTVLLADEPTGNLDAENADAVLDLLADFHQQGGTVLLATHDDRAAGRAEENVEMEGGRLARAPNEAGD